MVMDNKKDIIYAAIFISVTIIINIILIYVKKIYG